MPSRRRFLSQTAALALTPLGTSAATDVHTAPSASITGTVSLCGEWLFRTDPGAVLTSEQGAATNATIGVWNKVKIPHTWQIEPGSVDFRGIAWYRRSFDVPTAWRDCAVRIEFEAVFHTATVWINGQLAGEHLRKGYTAFTLDITHLLHWGQSNTIAVRVDSAFNEHMLPRGRSSDWAHDGGIFRPVQLLATPKTFVERVAIEAVPDPASQEGKLTFIVYIKNTSSIHWKGMASFRVLEDANDAEVLSQPLNGPLSVAASTTLTVPIQATLPKAKFWHFDHPNLYRLEFSIANEHERHEFTTTFGIRQLSVKDSGFYLNGERVRLMGVERMAGSNPNFGMAEPEEWIAHDHDDMKYLNCVFSRVHWPQDRRVLDYCDRHGILMQVEVPAWGWDTFRGMQSEPDADILENGLEQLREMVARDRNHPCVVAWGLCNEIAGQNPPAYQFAKHLLEEAKKLDPNRLCSYASNSLAETPDRDVAGLMDFIETNEYYGSWAPGSAEDVARHLDQLHAAFPGKPVVVSEYGYCACTADRPEGDGHRMEILRSHDAAIRSKDFMGGAIFFCYNDYRTHVGDHGIGALQQRIHGVVDIYGSPKSSYKALRDESGPIESVSVTNDHNTFHIRLTTRRDLPMYTLRGYNVRGIFHSVGDIPYEQEDVELPEIPAGGAVQVELKFVEPSVPLHIRFEVLRPTGFSAYSWDWKP